MKVIRIEPGRFVVVDAYGDSRDGPIELKMVQMIDDDSKEIYEAALTPEGAKELSEALLRSPAEAERAARAREL